MDITKSDALILGQKYLGGNWSEVTEDKVTLEVLAGGFCSRLYICEDISDTDESNSPKKFLIRLLGGKFLDAKTTMITLTHAGQAVLFYQLGQLGLGPKLYGTIEGGRLEEFIPSHTLTNTDLDCARIRNDIARKLARFHQMNNIVPVIQQQKDIFGALAESLEKQDNNYIRSNSLFEGTDIDCQFLMNFDYGSQFDWLRDTSSKIACRNVFCLNDMNRLNCLVRDEPDTFGEIVTLIDYELSAVGPRGVDIGNHFNWYVLDLSSPSRLSGLGYPDAARRRELVTTYLDEFENSPHTKDFNSNELDSVDHVLMEAHFYGLAMSLRIALGTQRPNKYLQEQGDDHVIGFMRMSQCLLKLYIQLRKEFDDKYDF